MGLFSVQTGQYEKAVSRFSKVIILDENRLDAYFQLASCYTALQDTSSAIEALTTLIQKSDGELKQSAKEMLEKFN